MPQTIASYRPWALVPVVGCLLFVTLYVIATMYYPGGSSFDTNAAGFSWLNNYWCNLLNDVATNGRKNSARPIAEAAMVVLSISLGFFWWQFPAFAAMGKNYIWLIRGCGILAVAAGALLLTNLQHDMVANIASLFGMLAMGGTFLGLHRMDWKKLFYAGVLNIILVAVNNYLYYHPELIRYLPLVQKITFACFLAWICGIHWTIFTGAGRAIQPESVKTGYHEG